MKLLALAAFFFKGSVQQVEWGFRLEECGLIEKGSWVLCLRQVILLGGTDIESILSGYPWYWEGDPRHTELTDGTVPLSYAHRVLWTSAYSALLFR